MPMFEDRERAFEAKFAHDEEFRFLVTARRDKLFADKIAVQLGLPELGRVGLIAEALAVPDGPGHDAALLTHMASNLAMHGHGGEVAGLATILAECAVQAYQQLLAQSPASQSKS